MQQQQKNNKKQKKEQKKGDKKIYKVITGSAVADFFGHIKDSAIFFSIGIHNSKLRS